VEKLDGGGTFGAYCHSLASNAFSVWKVSVEWLSQIFVQCTLCIECYPMSAVC
jgi:predicted CxxxxCH...CXXCH cytochrome family protein